MKKWNLFRNQSRVKSIFLTVRDVFKDSVRIERRSSRSEQGAGFLNNLAMKWRIWVDVREIKGIKILNLLYNATK